MKTRTLALAGLAAIALAVAGAVLLLDRLGGEPGPARVASARTPSPDPVAAPEPPASTGLPRLPRGPEASPVAAPPAAAPGAPPAAPPAGPRKPELAVSLARVRERIFACAGEDPAPRPASDPGAPGAARRRNWPAVYLSLQPGPGEVTVLTVRAQDRGQEEDPLVACARTELEGRKLEAGGYRPGARVRHRFSLEPGAP